MSDITRYDEVHTQAGSYLAPHPEGDWMQYDDHEKALADAYAKGVRDAAERIKSRLPNVPVIGGYIAEQILSLLDGKGASSDARP